MLVVRLEAERGLEHTVVLSTVQLPGGQPRGALLASVTGIAAGRRGRNDPRISQVVMKKSTL